MPRKCAATGRLIEAKDHASVQIAIADVDENGKIIPGQTTNIPIAGSIRHQGESDDSFNRLCQEMGRTYPLRRAAGHVPALAPDSLRLARKFIPRSCQAEDSSIMERISTYSGLRARRLLIMSL